MGPTPAASAPRSTWLMNTSSTPTAMTSTPWDIGDTPGMNSTAAVEASEHTARMTVSGHGASARISRGQV